MIPWWQGPLCAFDEESTGVDTREARTVQWCAADTAPATERFPHALGERFHVRAFSELVNPGIPIPREASEVHHIYDLHVQKTGNPPAESLRGLVDILADRIEARIPLTGMNLAYDFALLHWECLRHGVPTLLERCGAIMPVIDVLVLDKHASPYRKGKRKLNALCLEYGVKLDDADAHDAVADAIAATEVARVIGERYPEIGNASPMQLHVMQVEWRAEQCAGLQAYFRRSGKPDAYVDPCWPLCLDLSHPTT